MLSYIGMPYTVGKLRVPAFHGAGGHDRVFVSMVAAPMQTPLGPGVAAEDMPCHGMCHLERFASTNLPRSGTGETLKLY